MDLRRAPIQYIYRRFKWEYDLLRQGYRRWFWIAWFAYLGLAPSGYGLVSPSSTTIGFFAAWSVASMVVYFGGFPFFKDFYDLKVFTLRYRNPDSELKSTGGRYSSSYYSFDPGRETIVRLWLANIGQYELNSSDLRDGSVAVHFENAKMLTEEPYKEAMNQVLQEIESGEMDLPPPPWETDHDIAKGVGITAARARHIILRKYGRYSHLASGKVGVSVHPDQRVARLDRFSIAKGGGLPVDLVFDSSPKITIEGRLKNESDVLVEHIQRSPENEINGGLVILMFLSITVLFRVAELLQFATSAIIDPIVASGSMALTRAGVIACVTDVVMITLFLHSTLFLFREHRYLVNEV